MAFLTRQLQHQVPDAVERGEVLPELHHKAVLRQIGTAAADLVVDLAQVALAVDQLRDRRRQGGQRQLRGPAVNPRIQMRSRLAAPRPPSHPPPPIPRYRLAL